MSACRQGCGVTASQIKRLVEVLEGAHVAIWAGIDAGDRREAEAALWAADDWLVEARALIDHTEAAA